MANETLNHLPMVQCIVDILKMGIDAAPPEKLHYAQVAYYGRCREMFLHMMKMAGGFIQVDEESCSPGEGRFSCVVTHHSLRGRHHKEFWFVLKDRAVVEVLQSCLEDDIELTCGHMLYSIDRIIANEVSKLSPGCYYHLLNRMHPSIREMFPRTHLPN